MDMDWRSFARSTLRDLVRPDPMLLAERRWRWQWHWHWGLLAAIAGTLAIIGVDVWLYAIDLIDLPSWSTPWFRRPAELPQPSPHDAADYFMLVAYGTVMITAVSLLMLMQGRHPLATFSFGDVPLRLATFVKAAGCATLAAAVSLLVTTALEPRGFATIIALPFGSTALAWVLLGALCYLPQTLGEEMAYRGYLLRVWGAVMACRIVVIPPIIVLFTSFHVGNADFAVDPMANWIWFAVSESLAYWVLFRTGSLIACWAMHWANNCYSLVMPTFPGQSAAGAPFVKIDDVVAAGGSNFTEPLAWLGLAVYAGLVIALIAWRGSPFYLERRTPA